MVLQTLFLLINILILFVMLSSDHEPTSLSEYKDKKTIII